MLDILAVGELLIDFTPMGKGQFKANPGGAPCNFLTMAQKLGAKTAFIGKVGEDAFGVQLKQVLDQQGIDTEGLVMDSRHGTTLAFVHLAENGERSFSFYRKACADVMLSIEEVNLELLNRTKVLHFGSLSLTDDPIRSTVFSMLDYARAHGKLITYDPNYRPPLWNSEFEAIEFMKKGMGYADIVKVSEEELELITGEKTLESGCQFLREMGVRMVFVTLGEKGAYYTYEKGSGYVAGLEAKVADTTGAGDTFFGAVVQQLVESGTPVTEIEVSKLEQIISVANTAAAICVEGFGGIPSIPTKEQILNRL